VGPSGSIDIEILLGYRNSPKMRADKNRNHT
jgi:hypothetical protein